MKIKTFVLILALLFIPINGSSYEGNYEEGDKVNPKDFPEVRDIIRKPIEPTIFIYQYKSDKVEEECPKEGECFYVKKSIIVSSEKDFKEFTDLVYARILWKEILPDGKIKARILMGSIPINTYEGVELYHKIKIERF